MLHTHYNKKKKKKWSNVRLLITYHLYLFKKRKKHQVITKWFYSQRWCTDKKIKKSLFCDVLNLKLSTKRHSLNRSFHFLLSKNICCWFLKLWGSKIKFSLYTWSLKKKRQKKRTIYLSPCHIMFNFCFLNEEQAKLFCRISSK